MSVPARLRRCETRGSGSKVQAITTSRLERLGTNCYRCVRRLGDKDSAMGGRHGLDALHFAELGRRVMSELVKVPDPDRNLISS